MKYAAARWKGKTGGLNAIAHLMKPEYASLPRVINYRGLLCIPCTILMFGDFHVRVAYRRDPRSRTDLIINLITTNIN